MKFQMRHDLRTEPRGPAVITNAPSRPEGPQVVEATCVTMMKAPPKPAPRPAVRNGLPSGSVTP